MKTEEFQISVGGSQPGARLNTYILDTPEGMMIRTRPLILMCPGGGYYFTSDREAEPLAMRFLAMGCHVALFRYSCAPAAFPTALLEAAEAMKIIHAHAAEWKVAEDKIIVQGCSAGGHLAGCLGVFWNQKWLAEAAHTENRTLRPAGMMLCYPVITSGEFAHRESFENLLQDQYNDEMLEKVSLEKQVGADTPPTFLWHTYPDGCVPVENSLLMVSALRKYGISTEFHMYPVGGHGLSTAEKETACESGVEIQPECSSWLALAKVWLESF